jgi:YVTN family beta-propeller protein
MQKTVKKKTAAAEGGPMRRTDACCFVLFLVLNSASTVFSFDIDGSAVSPCVLFETLVLNRDLPTKKKPKYLSPVDMAASRDSATLFVAQQTAKRIDVIDFAIGETVQRILLPNEVTGIAIAPDRDVLYATCSSDLWPAGMVCKVDIATGSVTARVAVGHGARAPEVTPDGSLLFVCNRFDNDISVVDIVAGKERQRIPAVREPFCAAITPDGSTVVVGNLMPADLSTDTLVIASMITMIDVATLTVSANIRLPVGSHSVQGIAVSPDGNYAFVTHLIGHFNLIGTTVEKGWLHTNNLAVIDLGAMRMVNDLTLDGEYKGAGNPWGVEFSGNGGWLCVTHAGSDELSVIDYTKMMDTVLKKTTEGEDLKRDFAVLDSLKTTVTTDLRSPRALAVVGEYAYTAGYFADSLPVVAAFPLVDPWKRPVDLIAFDVPQSWNGEREGASNFCNATLCYQQWQSCHSCHPFYRADGLNWILGGGAIVAPKNCKSVMYSWWTPPPTWTGRAGHTQQGIAAGIELELFRAATRDLVEPIDTLFMYLKPVPSPSLTKGRLTEAARRGREMYYDKEKVACIVCHPPDMFTDNIFWNTGIPDPYDANTQWLTPNIVEAWRTAPYGHIGSMSLREIIEYPGHSNASENLTPQEIDDLLAYVRSL